jgi:hypothetical protein
MLLSFFPFLCFSDVNKFLPQASTPRTLVHAPMVTSSIKVSRHLTVGMDFIGRFPIAVWDPPPPQIMSNNHNIAGKLLKLTINTTYHNTLKKDSEVLECLLH